jgi:glycosyltransferase involved in cell wall biosynthesis
MNSRSNVYLLCWTGDSVKGRSFAESSYPGCQVVPVDQRQFRDAGWRSQRRTLAGLRGKALIFFFRRRRDLNVRLLLAWSGLIHHCRDTVLADEQGWAEKHGPQTWWKLAPATCFALVVDAVTLLLTWLYLRGFRSVKDGARRPSTGSAAEGLIAYLSPYPMARPSVGGAMSHMRGFLSGLAAQGAPCKIFAAHSLAADIFPETLVPARSRPFLFPEAALLSYNWRFARSVRAHLKGTIVRSLYQRHGRFVVAGSLLSRRLGAPLILEYNGSEVWLAGNWDPSRFSSLLALCEEFSLRSAAWIVVVSDVLRDELLGRGVPGHKILVNPNGVDPKTFSPGCGGESLRRQLGIAADDVVACFVGSFSYWHGIPELQQAILQLMARAMVDKSLPRLRFLMVGDGPLHSGMSAALAASVASGQVIFTGSIAHNLVPAHLDAADILLAPHGPMKDGGRFFGSPTKLFEYMAMGKSIVASNLEQIGHVLEHGRTALMVRPGIVPELVTAIVELAEQPKLRACLGENAREAALLHHTWERNAQAVLGMLNGSPEVDTARSKAGACAMAPVVLSTRSKKSS